VDKDEGWHLSKSVPATLLLGLVTQAAAIVWTVSMMMSDIDRNSQDIAEFNMRMQKVEESVQTLAISMARIDANISHIRGAVEKMASE
jgi:septal ring factor EnvC (AmiA/AmiB activator)